MPVSHAYTSVSFYTRSDVAYYAINDRAAGRRVIELDLMTTEQHNDLPDNEEITAADRLIVESPTTHRPDHDQGARPGAGNAADGARGGGQRALPSAVELAFSWSHFRPETGFHFSENALTLGYDVPRAIRPTGIANAHLQQGQRALAVERGR